MVTDDRVLGVHRRIGECRHDGRRPQPATTSVGQDRSVGTLTDGLKAIGVFVSGEPGHQALDASSARSARIDPYIVKLAGEIVAAQNELVADVKRNPVAVPKRLDATMYPEIATLHAAASAEVKKATQGQSPVGAAKDGSLSLAAAGDPCGDYAYPLPNYTPTRNNFSVSPSVRTFLTNSGYHQTVGYACGASGYTCADDYTKGIQSPYTSRGYCQHPRFRDQVVVTGTTTAWVQYGEPNPEIHSYTWPYWNWGNYVQWWHANH